MIHPPNLRQGHVGLVHQQQVILREIVQQGPRSGTGGPPRQMAGVVFHSGAKPGFLQHFQIVVGTAFQAGRFQDLALGPQFPQPLLQFHRDVGAGQSQPLFAGNEVLGGIDGRFLLLGQHFSGQGIQGDNALHFIPEKLDPHCHFLVGRHNFQGIPPHPELAPGQFQIVPLVLHFNQLAQQAAPVADFPHLNLRHQVKVILRVAQAVDAGYRSHNQHIPPGQQGSSSRQAQLVQFLVDAGVFFHIGIGLGNIRLRLVVIVVGNEILHRVVGKELLELGSQLRRQGLVMGDDQGGALHFLNDVRHSKGFAAAGNAQQSLLHDAGLHAGGQPRHGLRLVAGHLKIRSYGELRHSGTSTL